MPLTARACPEDSKKPPERKDFPPRGKMSPQVTGGKTGNNKAAEIYYRGCPGPQKNYFIIKSAFTRHRRCRAPILRR